MNVANAVVMASLLVNVIAMAMWKTVLVSAAGQLKLMNAEYVMALA